LAIVSDRAVLSSGNSGESLGPVASPAWNLLPGPFNNEHPADRMAHSSQ